jgi:transposase InsO family protein
MKYSKEFKDSTVRLILNDKESVVKVASDFDLNPQTLYNMKVSLVNDPLKMALQHRNLPRGLLWHTDIRSQYASYSHKELLNQNGNGCLEYKN